ncbi:MAG: DUF58 domain-containing protein [Archangiaceae bacterium]|nr:DUF58 domain-containing protein [Archangiaceae bacterium]
MAGTPAPTPRFFKLALLGLLPAVLAVAVPGLGYVTLAFDAALLALCALDFLLSPRGLKVERELDPVLSSGAANRVTLRLEGRARGELRDTAGSGPSLEGNAQPFAVDGITTVSWWVTPRHRGDLSLGPLGVRLHGPLGLCARQLTLPLTQTVKVYPDLAALSREALVLATAHAESSKRVLRRPAEGREFESLREYRRGDDRRTLDWKATARRGRPMVRVHQPEQNQTVLLLLDCGRHMAGEIAGRRKLEYAVDAALRLAKVGVDQGDQVGVMTFASQVGAWRPPRRGLEQLRAVADVLYRVEASFEESDYGAALDLAFARTSRRALVVVLTDLLDIDTSAALVKRTLQLVPRHLPLVASLLDEGLQAAALAPPHTVDEAYQRQVAARLEDEYRLTAARLRDAGARVIRAAARDFGPAAVNAYLELKARGAL